MNFLTMDYFLMVASKRNITKAAEELHITQQTLSAHISALEKELACQLFVRSNPLQLTYAGEVFLRHATHIYESWQAMWNEFNDLTHNQRGKLLVGIDYTRSRTLMPRIISAFQAAYPLIEVRVLEGTNKDLQQNLISKDIDLAIARFPEKIPGIEVSDFYNEEVIMLASKQLLKGDAPDAQKYLINLNDFQKYPFLLGGANDISSQLGIELLRRSNFQPIVKARSNNLETLLALCANNTGICFCPISSLRAVLSEEQINQMQIYHLASDSIYPIRFAHRQSSYCWNMVSEFIRISLEQKAALFFNSPYSSMV